jgi:Ca2+ transporting ATPase
MTKNIIIHSIFQLVILITLVFAGDLFIPEFPDEFDSRISDMTEKYHNGVISQGTVRSGRAIFANGDPDYLTVYNKYRVHSRHYTFIFNTFVMLQLFNFLNSRKL